jgi:anti-sigma factor RsiW
MSHSIGTPDRIDAYLDGELGLDERTAFEEEIERSPALREALAQRRDLDNAVRALPSAEVSPQFEARFRARLARAEDAGGRLSFLELARPWAAVLSGPALAAAALIFFLGNPSLPDSDWALITDAEAFELIMDEDPNLLATLDLLETWDPPETL